MQLDLVRGATALRPSQVASLCSSAVTPLSTIRFKLSGCENPRRRTILRSGRRFWYGFVQALTVLKLSCCGVVLMRTRRKEALGGA